jgi:transcriptional regulator with XRE-family HTH domain
MKLANKLNTSKGYLSSINKTNPSAHMIYKLEKRLKVPVEQPLNIWLELFDSEWS